MKILILSPVHHDDKALDVGDKVDLPAKAAEALIAAGAAEAMQGGSRRAAQEPATGDVDQQLTSGAAPSEQVPGDDSAPDQS